MYTFVTIVHIFASLVLVLVVLLQAGKGANMGAAFGGSSQTVFGSSGAGTFLGKMTAAIAIIFMVTSLTLTYNASRKGSSLFERSPAPVTRQEIPAIPVAPAQNAATPAAIPGAAKQPAAIPTVPDKK
ncbi:MAG: preprotein translocase subunit SecG [Smithellaceae bacterium]|jgi:preprotein translocase subunit SecG